MISILKIMRGYCKVRITGSGKERFLNLCKNKQILIWNLKKVSDGYTFYVSFKAYKILGEIGEKSNTHISIEGKYGLPFFLYRHKKRKMFFSGFLLCALTIYVCSLFVWDIQVIGTEQYTTDEFLTYLSEAGIRTGILKRTIDCLVIEEMIREDFENTAWVSCDMEGTLLTVQVKESINTEEIKNKKDQVPNDIIASKDGIIDSIITRNGTPLVKKGMEVKKGDVLISGIIYYYNDYDELLETGKISADGDIKARTVYRYEEHFPLSYYEKMYTNHMTPKYELRIGNYNLPEFGRKISYHKFDVVTDTYPLKIGTSFYLPFTLQIKKYKEYEPKHVVLSEEEAKEKAQEKISSYLKQLTNEGKEMIDKDFQISVKEGECRIIGTIQVIESIGKIRNIP